MLGSPEHLYLQDASVSGWTKTLGHLWDASQSGILDLPEGKFFLEGLLMPDSPEHLYLQNAWSLGPVRNICTSRMLEV